MEIEVDVDAALLQLGDEIVKFLELARLKVQRVGRMPAKEGVAPRGVQSVHSHEIKAEFRQAVGDAGRGLRRRKVGFAGEVHAPEPLASGIRKPEMPVTDLDEAVLASRRVEEKARV